MPAETIRFARAVCSACVVALAAGCWGLAESVGQPSPLAVPLNLVRQSPAPVPPLVLDAIVVDKKGTAVSDMKASDFEVLVDGKPRVGVAIARLFRGPGAAGLVAARQATMPGEMPPLAEPSRVVVFAVDEGSFLPGDERRARLVVENCLGLVGLSDRVMLVALPSLAGSETLSIERDPLRHGLGLMRARRLGYAASADAAAAEAAKITEPAEGVEERLAGALDRRGAEWREDGVAPDALARLDNLLPGGASVSSEAMSPPANKAHAVAMLDGLRRLLDTLGRVPGSKTVLLLSAGLVADQASAEMKAAVDGSAASFTRIYTIQVPTPAPQFSETGRIGLLNLARQTGGGLVMLTDRPAQALQRMVSELSHSYLLLLSPQPADFEANLRTVAVRTKRRDVTIRTSTTIAPGRLLPEAAAPPAQPSADGAGVMQPLPGSTAPVVTRPAPGALIKRAARPRDPALDAVLARVSEYAVNYRRELSVIVAEEVYEQKVTTASGIVTGQAAQQPLSRRTVSDYLLVKVPGDEGWTPFRDVFEVDGVKVRDRDDRLQRLFLEASPAQAVENANRIWLESARYNIGRVWRTVNVPTLAFMFAMPMYMPMFEFTKRGEPAEAGIRAWEIDFREIVTPTIIKTPAGGDNPATGTFWVDPVNGRMLRTMLKAAGATITVTYRPQSEMAGLWLPATMRERYEYPTTQIQATATYSKFRRFQVLTQETFRPPK